MTTLRFVCPEHIKEIDSGIETDPRSFQQCRDNRVELLCPHCNRLHEFRVAEGRIDQLRVA